MEFQFLIKMLQLRLIVLVFFIANLTIIFGEDDHGQSPLDPIEDETYLRLIFGNGTEQYFRNWECPDGIWAEDMFQYDQPKCACVKGVFAISKGLCDEEFEILTGNEHCYDISKSTIRKFTPLTGQMGLSGRANTVFRRDAPYFARLISATPTLYVNEPVHYLFRLNDPNVFSTYASLPDGSAARLSCFEAQAPTTNGSAEPIMQIAQLPDCSNEFRGPQDWCAEKGFGTYIATITLGTKWGPKASGAGTVYPNGCSSKSPKSSKTLKSKGRSMRHRSRGRRAEKKEENSQPKPKPPPKCDVFDPLTIEKPQQATPYIDHFVDRAEHAVHLFHTSSTHQKEVNEQTAKIAKSLMDFHLGAAEAKSKTKILRTDKLPAYRYIQISRQIMEKLCPEEYVPSYVLAIMVRMFRIIYLDIQGKYPYSEKMFENSTTNSEIVTSLTKCRDAAQPIAFMVNQTCPDAGIYGTNYSNVEYIYGKNLSIPLSVKFNLSSMDLPLEAVWKMMMLTHYYCADNFSNGRYHSEYVVKFEAFLRNPAVLYRWYHPGPANAIFKVILSAFNLKEFAKGIDRCVATANSISSYKGWLHRPADTLKWKSRYNETAIILNANATTTLNVTSGRSVKGTKGRRFKRYYFQNNLWDDKAYCLRNSKEIVKEVHSSLTSGCKIMPAWFQNTD